VEFATMPGLLSNYLIFVALHVLIIAAVVALAALD
jgi:hypothetical protein